MTKISQDLLDTLAELEVSALRDGLTNEEMRTNPAFLARVRDFLKQNKLSTQPETPGIRDIQKETTAIPIFEDLPN